METDPVSETYFLVPRILDDGKKSLNPVTLKNYVTFKFYLIFNGASLNSRMIW
jgi:hypothetical protein